MKNLYVIPISNGDGSFSVVSTFNKELIEKMEKDYITGNLDNEKFCGSKGFNYKIWTVPDECTAKTMGINELTYEDVY